MKESQYLITIIIDKTSSYYIKKWLNNPNSENWNLYTFCEKGKIHIRFDKPEKPKHEARKP